MSKRKSCDDSIEIKPNSEYNFITKKKPASKRSSRLGKRGNLYTPSNKRERLLSNNKEFSQKLIDPFTNKKVDNLVKNILNEPETEVKINLNDYFDAELAMK